MVSLEVMKKELIVFELARMRRNIQKNVTNDFALTELNLTKTKFIVHMRES